MAFSYFSCMFHAFGFFCMYEDELTSVRRYQAPHFVEQPKQQYNNQQPLPQQQPPRQPRVYHNAANEGDFSNTSLLDYGTLPCLDFDIFLPLLQIHMAKEEGVVEGEGVVGEEVDMGTIKVDMATTKVDTATTKVVTATTKVDLITTKVDLDIIKVNMELSNNFDRSML